MPPFDVHPPSTAPAVPMPEMTLPTTATMEQAEKSILDKIDEIIALIGDLRVQDVNLEFETIQEYKDKLARIGDAAVETVKDIRILKRTFSSRGMDAHRSQFWEEKILKLQSDVQSHRKEIKGKCIQERNSTSVAREETGSPRKASCSPGSHVCFKHKSS